MMPQSSLSDPHHLNFCEALVPSYGTKRAALLRGGCGIPVTMDVTSFGNDFPDVTTALDKPPLRKIIIQCLVTWKIITCGFQITPAGQVSPDLLAIPLESPTSPLLTTLLDGLWYLGPVLFSMCPLQIIVLSRPRSLLPRNMRRLPRGN